MEKKEFKPLGKALNIVASTKLEVTYTYDDLIFVEHNPFLLQFDSTKSDLLHLYFNKDCEISEAKRLFQVISKSASLEKMKIKDAGKFSLDSNEETQELQISFLN